MLADTVNFGFDAKHLRAHTPNLSSTKLEALIVEMDEQLSALDPQALPEVIYTGHSVFFGQLSGYILETQLVTIILTFCFIFVILMLEFDFRLAMAGMLACSLPILITMGSIAALGLPFDFATVIIASVTMGLSIDDTIHILHRYRFHLVDEHRSQFQSLRQALFIPGRPIVQSTLFCFGAGVFDFRFGDAATLCHIHHAGAGIALAWRGTAFAIAVERSLFYQNRASHRQGNRIINM